MKRVSLLGTEIAYRESGAVAAKPVVFLHGNPTSSYLWRKVIPEVEGVIPVSSALLVLQGFSEVIKCFKTLRTGIDYRQAAPPAELT